jgi:soluble lytic murein transglycosylase-like protein
MLPPLAAILVGILLAIFAFHLPAATSTGPATPGASGIAPLFTPEVQYWGGQITAWAVRAGVDPNLAATVMQIESCGDPQARSFAGAMGLFQVMPFHFFGVDDPFEPSTNAERGLAYLKRALDQSGGDARLALAGYNGGIGVIGRAEWSWAAETQRYTYWGSGIYADAAQMSASSTVLDEWLAAGGSGLCRQARIRLGLGEYGRGESDPCSVNRRTFRRSQNPRRRG